VARHAVVFVNHFAACDLRVRVQTAAARRRGGRGGRGGRGRFRLLRTNRRKRRGGNKRRGANKALASLCIGGGEAVALVVER